MIRFVFFLLLTMVALCAADDHVTLDAKLLTSLPARRHAAAVRLTITSADSTPAIGEKKSEYVSELKSMEHALLATYYWHTKIPAGIDEAIEKRAIYLAGLEYPGSAATGCSYYADLIYRYTIAMYEEQIVRIARAVCERLHERDVVAARGEKLDFKDWRKAWDDAGRVENGPNQTPEPCGPKARMAHRDRCRKTG